MQTYTVLNVGNKYSASFKAYVACNGRVVSPFHDISLYTSGKRDVVSVVNEIPRFESAKFEISKKLKRVDTPFGGPVGIVVQLVRRPDSPVGVSAVDVRKVILVFDQVIDDFPDVITDQNFLVIPGHKFIVIKISHHMPVHLIAAGIPFPEPFAVF